MLNGTLSAIMKNKSFPSQEKGICVISDPSLSGLKYAVRYEEDPPHVFYVSPAIESLLDSDFEPVFKNLRCKTIKKKPAYLKKKKISYKPWGNHYGLLPKLPNLHD